MDNTQLEMKLRANGFSDKNIIFLRKRLQTPDGELKTLHILLSELRKRFYTSVTIAIFMFLMAGYATFARNTGMVTGTLGLSLFYVFIFLPPHQ